MSLLTSLGLWILEKLAGFGIDWATNKHAALVAKKAEAADQANRAGAVQDSQAQQVVTDKAVEASHVQTDAARDRVHADAGGLDGVRKQSVDVNAEVDSANGDVR